jgi:septal ring factor EnvC (AmiA/AmiB activator)
MGIEMIQVTVEGHLHQAAGAGGWVLALAAGLFSLAATPAFSQEGLEQTQKLVKSVESTVKSISDTRQQLEKTVAGYNSIMDQTAKDTKDAYKGLGKDINESEKKVGEARVKVDEMNAEAARHFTAWKESAASITDPALRKRSEERLADAQARFQKIAAAGKDARATFDTLITDLKNQSTYLGSDLNTGAIASLKPDAAKFNARAKSLFGKIDGVNKMFGEYVASVKP